MKPTPDERKILLEKLRAALAAGAVAQADVARISGVDPSQVSRILAGEFVTFGSAVVRICNTLGVTPDATSAKAATRTQPQATARQVAWLKVERAVKGLWDETPDGAERLVRVLDAIAAVGDRTERGMPPATPTLRG
jgi:transcriptional regulator with XRE-family HTH domain